MNLDNIVKSVAMAEGKDPVVVFVKQLQELLKLKSTSPLNFVDLLNQLRSECDKDLARRVLAAKQGAYSVVLDILDKLSNDEPTVVACLQTLIVLMDGEFHELALES